jgi:hypothetical protein
MTDDADDTAQHQSESTEDGPGRIGIGLRLVLAVGAVAVGLLWIVRLVVADPGFTDGLLFELLAPLLILYLGVRYFNIQTATVRARRERHDED